MKMTVEHTEEEVAYKEDTSKIDEESIVLDTGACAFMKDHQRKYAAHCTQSSPTSPINTPIPNAVEDDGDKCATQQQHGRTCLKLFEAPHS